MDDLLRDILDHMYGDLEVGDVVRLTSSCRGARDAFRADRFWEAWVRGASPSEHRLWMLRAEAGGRRDVLRCMLRAGALEGFYVLFKRAMAASDVELARVLLPDADAPLRRAYVREAYRDLFALCRRVSSAEFVAIADGYANLPTQKKGSPCSISISS